MWGERVEERTRELAIDSPVLVSREGEGRRIRYDQVMTAHVASSKLARLARLPVLKRSLLLLTTLGCAAVACNAITGTGKYVVVDCVGEACTGDASDSDARSLADGGTDSSGPSASCGPGGGTVIAACSDGALGRSVHTAPDDPRLILLPTDDKEGPYVPNCMLIKAGQTVTWQGNLAFHPLIQRENSTLPNPIPTLATGSEGSVQFTCPGDYNFSCRNHRDSMLGTIRVLP